jgi:predicted nucleic acid-binding protein
VSLEELISRHDTLLLDSSTLLSYLDGAESVSPVARAIVDGLVRTGRNAGVVSAVSMSEVLVRPHRMGRARSIALGLLDLRGVVIRPVDYLVAAEAARMRAESFLRLPDALVLATGVLSSTSWLVTNDRRLASTAPSLVPDLHVCLLSDLT